MPSCDIFRYLMQLSQTRHFTLVIDEFQDFYRVNKAVLSQMQKLFKDKKFEKSATKNVRYEQDDVFYTFWFRFIFKYSYIIEIENYGKLQEIISRDYNTFSGLVLEWYFHCVAMESEEYTRLGRWWGRKGEKLIFKKSCYLCTVNGANSILISPAGLEILRW